MLEPTAPDHTPKPSIFTAVTIQFDHMTWGELRHFVALATRDGVGNNEEVCLAWDPADADDPYSPPIGLKFVTCIEVP